MPYLTPETVPEERDCRALLIPASSDWLAIFSGALTELTLRWNWEEQGITVDEALEVVNAVIAGYYDGCVTSGCQSPEGTGVFRLDENGNVQQLIDGEWVEPVGDAAIPPVPPRTEPTAEERRCLASANAANVMHELYESLTDSFNEDRTIEEAIAALLATIAIRFFWLAPIASWLLLAAIAALSVVYFLMELFLADLWIGNFEDVLRCILYNCSSDDGDVVTFDYPCFLSGLENALDNPDIDALQYRLLVQMGFIMNSIGGVDALNAAGATTDVEAADCDDCDNNWCYTVDLTEFDGGFTVYSDAMAGEWVSGVGWVPTDVVFVTTRTLLKIELLFDFTLTVDTFDSVIDYHEGGGAGAEGYGVWTNDFENPMYSENMGSQPEGDDQHIGAANLWGALDSISVWMQTANNVWGGTGVLKTFQLNGTGTKPTFLEAHGWVEC
jgi:hypothetical protein